MQRKKQDIYGLAIGNVPLDDNYSAGDTVEIDYDNERLEALGWVDGRELTETGAAIMNHVRASMRRGLLEERISQNAGHFVDEAVSSSWQIDKVDNDELVVTTDSGERRRYARSMVE